MIVWPGLGAGMTFWKSRQWWRRLAYGARGEHWLPCGKWQEERAAARKRLRNTVDAMTSTAAA